MNRQDFVEPVQRYTTSVTMAAGQLSDALRSGTTPDAAIAALRQACNHLLVTVADLAKKTGLRLKKSLAGRGLSGKKRLAGRVLRARSRQNEGRFGL
jgi:hypothetical protein